MMPSPASNLPVDVLWIARYDYSAGWRLRPHRHNYLQMILFLDGKGQITVEGATFPIQENELFLIRSNETHGLFAHTLVRTLDVKFRVAPGLLEDGLREAARMVRWEGPGVAARLERIRSEGEMKASWYREMCGALLTEIIYMYLRRDQHRAVVEEVRTAVEVVSGDQILQRAIACVEARYQGPVSIREIARSAGCTDRTLRLHFQNAKGLSPLAFLQRYRIGRAKTLIQYSDYTLKEIAQQTGFQTVNHFTRHFSALEGLSPAVWRQARLAGIRKDIYINPQFENRIFTEGEAPGDPVATRNLLQT